MVRPAIKELSISELDRLLRIMLEEGDSRDKSDFLFLREVCEEIALRKKEVKNELK